jgi:hypothetical protein
MGKEIGTIAQGSFASEAGEQGGAMSGWDRYFLMLWRGAVLGLLIAIVMNLQDILHLLQRAAK